MVATVIVVVGHISVVVGGAHGVVTAGSVVQAVIVVLKTAYLYTHDMGAVKQNLHSQIKMFNEVINKQVVQLQLLT